MNRSPSAPSGAAGSLTGSLIALMKTGRALQAQSSHPEPVSSGERVVRGGKVVYFPAPNGAVRIVGLGDTGEWIAEFACREIDFNETYVHRMEQHVASKAGVRIAIVG